MPTLPNKDADTPLAAPPAMVLEASWLRLVGVCALVLALLSGTGVVTVSTSTLYLLVIAAVAMTFPSVVKFSLNKDGISFERAVEKLQEGIATLDARTTDLGTAIGSGIGGKGGSPMPSIAATAAAPAGNEAPTEAGQASPEHRPEARELALGIVASDPQLGKWGGQAERNGRRLSGVVRQSALREDCFAITLSLESTDPNRPLTGYVQFHLHPTFPSPQERPVRNGRATLDLLAWGDFTVGALADNGSTALELNLAGVEAPPAFHAV